MSLREDLIRQMETSYPRRNIRGIAARVDARGAKINNPEAYFLKLVETSERKDTDRVGGAATTPWQHPEDAGFRLDGSFSPEGDRVSRELTAFVRKWANLRCREACTPQDVAEALSGTQFAERFSGWIEQWSVRETWGPFYDANGIAQVGPQCEMSAQSAIMYQPEVRLLQGLEGRYSGGVQ